MLTELDRYPQQNPGASAYDLARSRVQEVREGDGARLPVYQGEVKKYRANETQMSMTSSTRDPPAAAKPCDANRNPPFNQSRISEAVQESESTLAPQISRSNLNPQTVRVNTDALAFLLKLRMPLLVCDTPEDLFSRPSRSQLGIYQQFAIFLSHFVKGSASNLC